MADNKIRIFGVNEINPVHNSLQKDQFGTTNKRKKGKSFKEKMEEAAKKNKIDPGTVTNYYQKNLKQGKETRDDR